MPFIFRGCQGWFQHLKERRIKNICISLPRARPPLPGSASLPPLQLRSPLESGRGGRRRGGGGPRLLGYQPAGGGWRTGLPRPGARMTPPSGAGGRGVQPGRVVPESSLASRTAPAPGDPASRYRLEQRKPDTLPQTFGALGLPTLGTQGNREQRAKVMGREGGGRTWTGREAGSGRRTAPWMPSLGRA